MLCPADFFGVTTGSAAAGSTSGAAGVVTAAGAGVVTAATFGAGAVACG